MSLPELPEYDDRDPEHGPRYLLLMPFMCVESVDGPFDDKAFVAGVQLGTLDAKLAVPGLLATTEMVYEELEAQSDLLAMHYGLKSEVLWRSGDGWIHVGFTRESDASYQPEAGE